MRSVRHTSWLLGLVVAGSASLGGAQVPRAAELAVRAQHAEQEGAWRTTALYFAAGQHLTGWQDDEAFERAARGLLEELAPRLVDAAELQLRKTFLRRHRDGAFLDFEQRFAVGRGAQQELLPILDAHARVVLNERGELSAIVTRLLSTPQVAVPDGALATAEQIAAKVRGQTAMVTQWEPVLRDGLPTSPGVPAGIVDGAPETRAVSEPASLEPVHDDGLAIFAGERGPQLSRVLRCNARSVYGRTTMRVVVDPCNGAIREARDLSCYHGGHATIHPQSPLASPVENVVEMPHLDGSGYLRGDWVTVRPIGLFTPAYDPALQFHYAIASGQIAQRSQTIAYWCGIEAHRAIAALAHPDLLTDVVIEIDGSSHNQFDHSCACIVINPNGGLSYGYGNSDGLNGDIAVHELGHKVQWDHIHYLSGGSGSVEDALKEGFADAFALTHYSACPGLPIVGGRWHCFEQWTGNLGAPTLGFVRTGFTSFTLTAPPVSISDFYRTGLAVIVGPSRDLTLKLGRATVRRLLLRVLELRPQNFIPIVESFVQADHDLYAGVHEALIRETFAIREMYGASGASPWPSSPYPASAHPYADSVDDTQSHTIPGASALRVVFHPATRLYYGAFAPNSPTYYDLLHVSDGQGNPIPGSPFTEEQLQGAVVEVPGDTVRFRLWSIPGNQRVAFGYRCLSIAARDPLNQPPQAAFTASASQVMVPAVVRFDAAASFDPDGRVVAYRLDPGDGSDPIHLDPRHPQAEHLYHFHGCDVVAAPTALQATLRVTDEDGDTHTIALPILLQPHVVNSRYELFGSGCGAPTPTLDYLRSPRLGDRMKTLLRGAPPTTLAALTTGLSSASYLGIPLPLDLAFLGAQGCALHVAMDFTSYVGTDAGGAAEVEFAIPSDPIFFGLQLYQQYIVLAPTANPLGLVLTGAGRATIGDN